MPLDYIDDIALAREMITYFGSPCIFSRYAEAGYSPNTTETTTEETPSITFTSYAFKDTSRYYSKPDMIVNAGDCLLYVELDDVYRPEIGDFAEFMGDKFRINDVAPITEQGQNIMFICKASL